MPIRVSLLLVSCIAVAVMAVAAPAADAPLPLERVVLFTSGVGYYQHSGKVVDDATVEMQFAADDVNDLLKSMVVLDAAGGPPTVSYASRDPVTKTLGTFAVNLTDNPSLGDLLGRLRGQRVELDAATPVAGTIVGVEKRRVEVGKDQAVEKQFLTVLTADGLRAIPLDAVARVKLVDPRLQAELEKALAVLALAADNEKKGVSIAFSGAGERPVTVGYVRESPIWKTSYRLLLDADTAVAKAALQGWAIVENTSDADWKNVRMSLVSGRPISFVMDLYQPLYISRPLVEPELYAALRPQVYGQSMADAEKQLAQAGRQAGARSNRDLARREMAKAAAPAPAAMMADGAIASASAASGGTGGGAALAFGITGASLAQGSDLGELFRYEIEKPVTLERQRSAMLPIVGGEIEAERVAIYDERVLARHPLSGLRLKNTTDFHLMQGPVTVYDQRGGYSGDARIEDMAPGTERLLSYAVDLDVEVAPRAEGRPEEIVSVRLVKGTLVATRKLARAKVFEVKNSGKDAVKVLVEHPLEAGWKLVKPEKPAETTRDRYRFAVAVDPGETTTLEVAEELPVEETHAITNLDDDRILFYSRTKATSPAVRESLAEVIRRKREIEQRARDRQVREQEIATIDQEQARIRGNMGAIDRGSDLFNQYVKKFTEQEQRIEALRSEIAALHEKEQEARKALDDYLLALDVK
ncbi:MAG: hypothetical protein ACKO40_07190 [Planctomycetaceae bacterium]